MKRLISLSIILLLSYPIFAQFNSTIRTGRPGQSIGAYTLGKNVFQVQSGINYNTIGTANSDTKIWLHNTVLRYGILEKFEVSGVFNWQTDEQTINSESNRRTGISNTQLGLRYNILERKGAIPAIGLQGRLLLKVQSEEYRRNDIGARIVLATGNKISDKLGLVTNWGITWSGNGGDPQTFFSVTTSYGFTDKLGGFVEVYGNFNDFDANFDTGLYFLVNNDLQLDISTGWQGDGDIDNWFLDFGVSWRVHWRESK